MRRERRFFKNRVACPGWCSSGTECWPVNRRVAGSIPSRTHTWVVGQVLSRGRKRGNHTLMFLSLSPSLPLSLKIKIKKMDSRHSYQRGDNTVLLGAAEKAPQERLTPRFLETDDIDSAHCSHLYDGLYAPVKGRDLAI